MTPSEKFVAELCKESFLPFWSFPSPLGKKEKELCDVFVVCENHIIIISVKDITVSNHPDENVQYERWTKKAINDSVEQIYGAERFLKTTDQVYSKDKSTVINLPKKENRIVHRIAIAFGSNPDFPIVTGDFGKGYVHVFDEKSTWIILNELDTITDFTNYLIAKEQFVADKRIQIPTEADFLAFYLQTGLNIQYPADLISSQTGIWEEYQNSNEYAKWREDIQVSFIWDRIITRMYDYHIANNNSNTRRDDIEESVRTINLEPRINRIELGSIFQDTIKKKLSARMLLPLEGSDHTYVFIPLTDKNWDEKESELQLRCIVARAKNPETKNVIGIAMGSNSDGETHYDICYLRIEQIDDSFIQKAKKIQDEFGYFNKPQYSRSKDFR